MLTTVSDLLLILYTIVFYIIKGTVTLYTEKGHPFIKYKDGDTLGDSDTLLNVYYYLLLIFSCPVIAKLLLTRI
jgi:hypothetical protein